MCTQASEWIAMRKYKSGYQIVEETGMHFGSKIIYERALNKWGFTEMTTKS